MSLPDNRPLTGRLERLKLQPLDADQRRVTSAIGDLVAPRFSIVIVTYGQRAATERCLASLDACYGDRLGADVELVLVDNASPDDTPALLRSWADRATVICNPRNLNYAGGNNVGARAARGDVLIFLNNDTELLDGGLDALAEQALVPGVGISGCRLLYPDGTIQHAGCAWWREPGGKILPFHLFQYESGDIAAAAATYDGDAVTGACLAIRRELFLALGGLDELYFNGLEDIDLCVRARLDGHRVVYRGDVALIHAEGASRSQRPDDVQNQRLFVTRYGHLTQEDTARFTDQFGAIKMLVELQIHPGDTSNGTEVSVEGEMIGLAAESAEARALLHALEAADRLPATREWQLVHLAAALERSENDVIDRARLRPKRHSALIIQAPVGQLGQIDVHARAVLRLAHMPLVDVSPVAAVWAASETLAADLIGAGLDADQVHVLLPPVHDVACGPGGQGLLALLPGHDLSRCRQILGAVAAIAPSMPVRVMATLATQGVVELVAELAPGAELLGPISSEHRFAALACECDVVVSADPRDVFERRALLATAAGACAVHLPGGVAASVLGDELAFDGSPAVLLTALQQTSGRIARSRLMLDACGPAATAVRLTELLAAAGQRSRPRSPALALR
jgi:GT2 family glycosyltransferase